MRSRTSASSCSTVVAGSSCWSSVVVPSAHVMYVVSLISTAPCKLISMGVASQRAPVRQARTSANCSGSRVQSSEFPEGGGETRGQRGLLSPTTFTIGTVHIYFKPPKPPVHQSEVRERHAFVFQRFSKLLRSLKEPLCGKTLSGTHCWGRRVIKQTSSPGSHDFFCIQTPPRRVKTVTTH